MIRDSRPVLLDLFCGAGGCAKGYQMVGFKVVGVDIKPQPRYSGDEFIQGNAIEFAKKEIQGFDVIHASPPCQAYTNQGRFNDEHPKLIEPIRDIISKHKFYVIENVVRAPLIDPIILCGSMFDLNVRRHRKFESSVSLTTPSLCRHKGQDIRAYYGAWGREAFRAKRPGNKDTLRGTVERAPKDMGIDWMVWDELREAIPPAYTEFVGGSLIKALGGG